MSSLWIKSACRRANCRHRSRRQQTQGRPFLIARLGKMGVGPGHPDGFASPLRSRSGEPEPSTPCARSRSHAVARKKFPQPSHAAARCRLLARLIDTLHVPTSQLGGRANVESRSSHLRCDETETSVVAHIADVEQVAPNVSLGPTADVGARALGMSAQDL